MKTAERKKIRQKFENETGKGSEIPSFIDEPITFTKMYAEWLENKVIASQRIDRREELVNFADWTFHNALKVDYSLKGLGEFVDDYLSSHPDPLSQEITDEMIEKTLINEAIYLLFKKQPDSCPNWIEGIGDCNKPECEFCRIQRCIDELEICLQKQLETIK
jgi:hypothetical protein